MRAIAKPATAAKKSESVAAFRCRFDFEKTKTKDQNNRTLTIIKAVLVINAKDPIEILNKYAPPKAKVVGTIPKAD